MHFFHVLRFTNILLIIIQFNVAHEKECIWTEYKIDNVQMNHNVIKAVIILMIWWYFQMIS